MYFDVKDREILIGFYYKVLGFFLLPKFEDRRKWDLPPAYPSSGPPREFWGPGVKEEDEAPLLAKRAENFQGL